MYKLYMNKILMPIPPSSIKTKINGQNKTINLINEGEVNIIKTTGLTDIEFDLLLPNMQYPFATKMKYGFKRAWYFLERLEQMKQKKKPFTFALYRTLPDGKLLYNTIMKVTLENYDIKEDAKEGFDVVVGIKLKQYVSYGTKKVTLTGDGMVKVERVRDSSSAPKTPCTYTVKKGDTLWSINKYFYGNSLSFKYHRIVKANKLTSCEDIPVGTVLKIP